MMDIATSAPPQRQSCDRCHRQKLRCTREKNTNGGVCDRCLGRRTQCVYSFSLPKGRPSSFRRPDESASKSTSGANESGTGKKLGQGEALSTDDGNDVEMTSKMIKDTTGVGASVTNEQSILTDPMDTSASTSASLDAWPQFDTLKWDNTQLGVDWSGHETGGCDTVLASLSIPGEDMGAPEELIPSLSNRLHYHQSSRHPTHIHSELENGSLVRHDCGAGKDVKKVAPSDGQSEWPDSIIAQLSRFITSLSAIRHSSSVLAKAALLTSCCAPNGSSAPLIDAAAFKSVGAWLAHGHGSNPTKIQTSTLDSIEYKNDCPVPLDETETQAGHGILHDVFSASHRMLEILRKLQAKNESESSRVSTANAVSRPSTALSVQDSLFAGLVEGPWSSTQLYSSNSTHTAQIIRHLVLACEALLLEIYMAILTALQHDVSHHTSGDTTSLGDVRLVMTVQLCSFLIERQQQAVDLYLAPQSPISPVSVNGTSTHVSNIFTPQQPVLPGGIAGVGEIELLRETKNQLQGRLAQLRQTLQYT